MLLPGGPAMAAQRQPHWCRGLCRRSETARGSVCDVSGGFFLCCFFFLSLLEQPTLLSPRLKSQRVPFLVPAAAVPPGAGTRSAMPWPAPALPARTEVSCSRLLFRAGLSAAPHRLRCSLPAAPSFPERARSFPGSHASPRVERVRVLRHCHPQTAPCRQLPLSCSGRLFGRGRGTSSGSVGPRQSRAVFSCPACHGDLRGPLCPLQCLGALEMNYWSWGQPAARSRSH